MLSVTQKDVDAITENGFTPSMKQTIQFNGEAVEFTFNTGKVSGLISTCSHWEWIHDMVKAGIVEKANVGDGSVPPDFRLSKGLRDSMSSGESMESKVMTAAVLGTLAFKVGIQRIPALDKDLEPLFVGNQIGEGAPILKAWLNSWDAANICATV